ALFEKYPICTTNQEEEHIHLLIIGFGPLGQQIALQTATQSEQFEMSSLQITAVDKHMTKIKRDWERNYREVYKEKNISLCSFDIEVDPIESIVKEQDIPMTHIYVCLNEDNLDLLAGIELSNQLPHIPIYLEFSEGSIADKWIQ